MRLAQIVDGVVSNVAEVDPDAIPDFMSEWIETEEAGPGWLWSDADGFLSPDVEQEPTPIPEVISRLQARMALLGAGLLQKVEAHISSSGDVMLQLAWAEATEWRRDSPTIARLAVEFSLSSDQVDDLFRAAGEIRV
ncbi:hypothetical protein [Pseudogemmobacter faecipullorum]|uniref:Uncharacterized protein n=1 Tax=Pseudogemmobacter faecipullorum TaxID=2755041 RepID=A0ABS8CPK8_9RHOB|nr:hypothetical protein [Pseudogemmobacter faecipullorum]MCB5411325.1 hypothetical protein [Pseudogemmobacter faecipullorum]